MLSHLGIGSSRCQTNWALEREPIEMFCFNVDLHLLRAGLHNSTLITCQTHSWCVISNGYFVNSVPQIPVVLKDA